MTINNEYRTVSEPATGRRMIYRHTTDRSLGGVCAGLADFLHWDPVLVRALWVVATFATSGAGFMVYLLLWLLLPVGTQATGQQRPAAIQFNRIGSSRIATVLVVLGGLWLLSNLGILPALTHVAGGFLEFFFWPLLLIGIGYLLLRGRGDGLRARFDDMRSSVGEGVRGANSTVRGVSAEMPIRRSRTNRMVLGLCGGLSNRLGVDANLIRLAWVILSLGTLGLGMLIYFAVALVVPEEGSHWSPDLESTARRNGHVADVQGMQDVPVSRVDHAPATPAPANDVSPLGSEIVHL